MAPQAEEQVEIVAEWGGRFAIVPRDIVLSDELHSARPAALKVWLVLLTYANGRTSDAWPRVGILAKEARVARETVIRATTQLAKLGLLRKGPHPTLHNRIRYTLLVPPSVRAK